MTLVITSGHSHLGTYSAQLGLLTPIQVKVGNDSGWLNILT
jgi:hypothetical protein